MEAIKLDRGLEFQVGFKFESQSMKFSYFKEEEV